MLKIGIYFTDRETSSCVYLSGISKRLNSLGFQPVAHDRFRFEDFGQPDQQLITETSSCSPVDVLEVRKRDFSFGIKFSELNIYLEFAGLDKNQNLHEAFDGEDHLS